MKLPVYVENVIEKRLNNRKVSEIVVNRKQLTENYKGIKNNKDPIREKDDFLAYIISRFPCTYAVGHKVLDILKEYQITSMIDVGSGPGTLAYAGLELFNELKKVSLIERNKFFIEFINEVSKDFDKTINFIIKNNDIERNLDLENHDLVTISYVLNELQKDKVEKVIKDLWKITNKFLVIIEPGTPKGFENIRFVRDILISQGAYILAPCTHNLNCPMENNDWCHFYKRVERSKLQKYLKAGKESYEDEKFSYLILSKTPFEHVSTIGRILRFPKHNKASSEFSICSTNGAESVNITTKNTHYKISKKLTWGDLLIQE